MPRVEKVRGASVYYRALDRDFEIGDCADVDADHAEYLVEERGDFEYVENDEPAENEVRPDATERDRLADYVDERTISEIDDDLKAGEHDEQLDLLADVEQDGQGRKGVHEAIDARRNELED